MRSYLIVERCGDNSRGIQQVELSGKPHPLQSVTAPGKWQRCHKQQRIKHSREFIATSARLALQGAMPTVSSNVTTISSNTTRGMVTLPSTSGNQAPQYKQQHQQGQGLLRTTPNVNTKSTALKPQTSAAPAVATSAGPAVLRAVPIARGNTTSTRHRQHRGSYG
eukprot:1147274-Pelagomonas_calceolata.AAC.5